MTPNQILTIATVYAARLAIERASSAECPAARQRLRLAMLRASTAGVTPWSGDELLASMPPATDGERDELEAMGRA